MSDRDEALAIRRILVALDASHHSLAALDAAVELAAALKAHLEGVFVEDIRLLRVAGHPMAREVRFPYVATGSLDPARMRREFRAQANEARRALDRVCEAHQIEWSFRVVRGEVAAAVLRASQQADLLSVGIASRPLDRQVRLGSTAHAAAMQTSLSVLVSQHGMHIAAPILVVYDGSAAAKRGLEVAMLLTEHSKGYLSVAIVAGNRETAGLLRREVAGLVRKKAPFARYRHLPNAAGGTLIAAVRAESTGLLVLCGVCTPLDDLQAVLDAVACPVLLIR